MNPTISNSVSIVKCTDDEQGQRDFNRVLLLRIPADRQLGIMLELQEAVRDISDPFAALHRQGFLLAMVRTDEDARAAQAERSAVRANGQPTNQS